MGKMLWICAVAFVIATSMNTCVSADNLAEIKWKSGVNTPDLLNTTLDDDKVRAIEVDVIWGVDDSRDVPTTTTKAPTTTATPNTTTTTTKAPAKPGTELPTWKPDEPTDPDFDFYKVILEDSPNFDALKHEHKKNDAVIAQKGHKSNFTLSAFLKQVIEHSKSHEKNMKSIKLNFEEFDKVVPRAVELLQSMHREIKFPIWLNADGVVRGPSGDKPHIKAKDFIAAYNLTDKYVLSLGWTTKFRKGAKDGYTKAHIDEMTKVVHHYVGKNTQDGLNFPIHAAYAIKSQESKDILKEFMKDMNKDYSPVTFSFWSDEDDEFFTDKFDEFCRDIGNKNVYLTLREDLHDKITCGASQLIKFGLLNLATLAIVTIFRNGLH